jgi:gamma-glutamylcyclotransferase (GGCT)/AIG2-like uncharacterized protein YtfP
MLSPIINKFFVYGTLRPDIKVEWSDITHKNPDFELKYYEAYLSHSKLFLHKIGYPICVYYPDTYSEDDITIGFILESDNVEETLKILDHIECYPFEYDRKIVTCYNSKEKKLTDAYFYFMQKEKIKNIEIEDLSTNDYKKYIEENISNSISVCSVIL